MSSNDMNYNDFTLFLTRGTVLIIGGETHTVTGSRKCTSEKLKNDYIFSTVRGDYGDRWKNIKTPKERLIEEIKPYYMKRGSTALWRYDVTTPDGVYMWETEDGTLSYDPIEFHIREV